jgi:hypothetical protein
MMADVVHGSAVVFGQSVLMRKEVGNSSATPHSEFVPINLALQLCQSLPVMPPWFFERANLGCIDCASVQT